MIGSRAVQIPPRNQTDAPRTKAIGLILGWANKIGDIFHFSLFIVIVQDEIKDALDNQGILQSMSYV